MSKLTEKQRTFCQLYAENGGNSEQAALGAGYSQQYAKSKSYKLIEQPHVAQEINRIRQRMNQMAEKSATDVVNEFSKVAFTDRVSFLKEDPLKPGEYMYKSPDELTDDQRAVVEKVNIYTTEIVILNEDGSKQNVFRQEYGYVLSDKMTALNQMGRHFGIFDDKLRLTTSTNQFKHLSSDQLLQLKAAFANVMTGNSNLIDAKTGMLIGNKADK